MAKAKRTAAREKDGRADEQAWIDRWLDAVVDGTSSMSQRTVASVEARGGVAALARRARAKGVHIVELTDDRGNTLLAASVHPFRVVC